MKHKTVKMQDGTKYKINLEPAEKLQQQKAQDLDFRSGFVVVDHYIKTINNNRSRSELFVQM